MDKFCAVAFYYLLLTCISTSVFAERQIFGKPPPVSDQTPQKIDPFLPLMPRKDDLSSIKQYGHLRVVFVENEYDNNEFSILREFAEKNSLKITRIWVKEISRGEKFVRNGLADILIGSGSNNEELTKTIPFEIKKGRSVFWSVRSGNIELQNALDDHLNQYLGSKGLPKIYLEDLSRLKKRKILRVATRTDPKNYFLKNGRPVGFEYELLQRFSKGQGLWLDIIISNDEVEMLEWLKEGKVDMATSAFINHENTEVTYSLPYYPARNFIITRKSEQNIEYLEDINGKELAVHSGKYQHKGIEFLMDNGFIISKVEPSSEISISAFLKQIVNKKYTIAMVSARDYIYATEFHDDLKIIGTVNDQPLHRWVVNQQHKELNTAINSFLTKMFRSEFYNVISKRYFPEAKKEINEQLSISPYDDLVIKYAEKYQFDWRLVMAQIYQESKFQPDAYSDSGARGLMQLMPGTAQELGYSKIEDPEISIKAGLKYMNKLRNRYIKEVSESERNWFTLAAYNAGYERIQDARKFAEKLELDPDRWFDHVEQAMQKLARPENRKHTRFGFCRCGQTVNYVRSIRKLYNSYIHLSDPEIIASYREKLLTDIELDLPH